MSEQSMSEQSMSERSDISGQSGQSQESQAESEELEKQPFNPGGIIMGAFTLLILTIASGGWILIPAAFVGLLFLVLWIYGAVAAWQQDNNKSSSGDGRDP